MAHAVKPRQFSYGDLTESIMKVPSLATGVKSFPDMATTYFERHVLKENSVPRDVKLFAEFIFSKISIKEKLNSYFDSEPPFELEESILSGSWSEGLVLFDPDTFDPPDVDFMCVLKNISFTQIDQMSGDLSINENSPFVSVYLSDINLLNLWQSYLLESASDALQGKICQLSATKLKQRLYENYSKRDNKFFGTSAEYCEPVTDSPALKLSRLPFDVHGPFWTRLLQSILEKIWRCCELVLAINCEGWPQNALEWMHRERQWPPEDVVKRVSKGGFHVVAKSSREGNFRLSFSRAEGILMENLNKIQHKVIRAFKAVVKYLLPCNSDNEKTLCSYHLKTIALWHLEKSPSESWIKENAASHLLDMLKELAHALRTENLPMYFLREYNLFGNVENSTELENLSHKVEAISRDISALTKAVRMAANFRFYESYSNYVKTLF